MIRTVILSLIMTFAAQPAHGAQDRASRLIVVTVDGLRWQELFTGIDADLMTLREAGVKRVADHELMKSLWANDSSERRKKLFPFFWGDFVEQGMLLGNRQKQSEVNVTNQVRKSYPGYAEILTGQAFDKKIKGNAAQTIPAPTILEALKKEWALDASGVALIASWDRFKSIAAQKANAFVVNAGFQNADWPNTSARAKAISKRQFEQLTPWTEVRHDYITCELALDYLKMKKPRVLYLGLGETDDWAHDKRYPRVLWAASYFDHCLRELVQWIDTDVDYKGQTLLVVTTDHGRGRTPADWHHHKISVPGSEEIWFYMRGPGVNPQGEVANSELMEQRDIAPTILKYLGIPLGIMPGMTGKPLP